MKLLNLARRYGAKLGMGAVALVGATSAFAVGPASPDLTTLVPDFTTVTTGLLAVAAAVITVYVTWKGAKMVINGVKGA